MHVVITGASSGIGAALTHEMAAAGHALTLVARRRDAIVEATRALTVPVRAYSCDLAELDGCTAWLEDAVAAHGPVDVLINNAGMQYVEKALGVGLERAERLMRLNYFAPMRLTEAVVHGMVARGRGAIVNITSLAGIISTPGMLHYNAAKAALSAASETLRVELRRTGVHVVTVYPGPVRTAMEAAARESLQHRGMVDRVPTGTPEVLARRIHRAIERRQARVIYPRIYGLARHFRLTTQWLTDRLTPAL